MRYRTQYSEAAVGPDTGNKEIENEVADMGDILLRRIGLLGWNISRSLKLFITDDVADRLPSNVSVSELWDHHQVGIVFVASVVGATALLGVVLLVVKWLEKCCVSASATDDGQEPTTGVLLRAGKRWRRKSKMRRQTGLMSTSSDESKEAEDVWTQLEYTVTAANVCARVI